MSQQHDVCVFHIQTLFMYTEQISSCVICECVCVYTARTLWSLQLLERLCQTGRHPTFTVVHHYVPPPLRGVWQSVAAESGGDKNRERQMHMVSTWEGSFLDAFSDDTALLSLSLRFRVRPQEHSHWFYFVAWNQLRSLLLILSTTEMHPKIALL